VNEAAKEQPEQNDQRLKDIEARLLAQEHRWTHVLHNLWFRNQWPENDPRRQAVVSAFLWRIVAPGSIVVAGGGAIAAGTLVFLALQTNLLRDQNKLIKDQNTYFQQQIEKMQEQTVLQRSQAQIQRRTQLTAWLYETNSGGPIAHSRIRAEALAEFITLERERLGGEDSVSLEGARLDGISITGMSFEDVRLSEHLRNSQFNDCTFKKISFNVGAATEVEFTSCLFVGCHFNSLTQGRYAQSIFINSPIPAELIGAGLIVITIPDNSLNDLTSKDARTLGVLRNVTHHGVSDESMGWLLAGLGPSISLTWEDFGVRIGVSDASELTNLIATIRFNAMKGLPPDALKE
jgi:hypothetical protein